MTESSRRPEPPSFCQMMYYCFDDISSVVEVWVVGSHDEVFSGDHDTVAVVIINEDHHHSPKYIGAMVPLARLAKSPSVAIRRAAREKLNQLILKRNEIIGAANLNQLIIDELNMKVEALRKRASPEEHEHVEGNQRDTL